MARGRPPKIKISQTDPQAYFEIVSNKVQNNQSRVSIILGALIILVAGILVFNYFQRGNNELGPAQKSQMDVSPQNLPGKYTVKDGDTLFIIAQKYYNDGYKYTAVAKANNLANADIIEAGQVLDIPKLEGGLEWGAKITGNTYTVVAGDWLSTIAGRSYGDIYSYDKIAKANNIQNPDLIEPGTILTIPR